MNWRNIFAVTKKDLLEVRQNKAAWLPMLIVPAIMVVILPLAIMLLPQYTNQGLESLITDPDLKQFLANLPATIQQQLAGKTEAQSAIILILGYMFAPLFLIFPLMYSTVIAAESFAGERERKTLEALLYTPISDQDLFLGKVFAALLPAVLISWLSFIVYGVLVNAVGYPIFNGLWFPQPEWWPLILWITPALAVLGISVTVLISSRTQTFMGAYQTSSALVLIAVGLMIGQLTGVLYLSIGIGVIIGLILWLIAIGLTSMAIRSFNRSALLISGS